MVKKNHQSQLQKVILRLTLLRVTELGLIILLETLDSKKDLRKMNGFKLNSLRRCKLRLYLKYACDLFRYF